MKIKWDEITIDHLQSLEMVFQLYDSVFPIEVREPHTIFLNGLHYTRNHQPNTFHFLAGLDRKQLVSFATGHYFEEVNAGFIVYIATTPSIRGKGIGSKTLLKMEELLKQDAIAAGNTNLESIILETETHDMVQTIEEKNNCIKRIEFFKKNQYKWVEGIDYLQPPLHKDHEAVPLTLLIKNQKKNKSDIKAIEKIVHAIYKEKYHLINGIDKQILNNCLQKMELNQLL